MKKRAGLWLGGFIMLCSLGAQAQSYADEALIFSRINSTGSSRIQAMGGAQVALGGDYSSAFSNPAGLGFYNKSEATFSFGQNFYNSSSDYFGATTKDSRGNFNVPGFSVVLHSEKNDGKLVSGNFALSLTRTNNFNQNFSYETGPNGNPYNSLLDYFVQQSSNPDTVRHPNDRDYTRGQFDPNSGAAYYYLARLAYNNYLIGPRNEKYYKSDSSLWHTYIGQIPFQHENTVVDGAQNQFNISYGLNFNDKVYVGAGIGLPSFHYHSKKTYYESFADPNTPIYGFDLTEDYTIKGSGINATIGALIRAKDFIQFGLSIATPTYFYDVNDNYSAVMTSVWDNYKYVDVTNPSHSTVFNQGEQLKDSMTDLVGNYALTTPWRIKAGTTVFIQKHGLITAEIESVNYSKSKLTSNTDGLDFTGDNSDIKDLYTSVLNIRGGGEYRINKFRARLGYSYMPDPYAANPYNVGNAVTSYTGGVGYRSGKFFTDLGLSLTQWNSAYVPYHIAGNTPVVKIQHSTTALTLTFGVNF